MPTIIQRKCQITECHFGWDVNGKEGVNLLFCYSKHIVLQLVFVKAFRIPVCNIVCVYNAYYNNIGIHVISHIKMYFCLPKCIPF